jgi:hypothetical protein
MTPSGIPQTNTNPELADELKLEYYKYLASEIRSLNENFHKFLSWFQTLATAILGVGIAFWATWQNMNMTAETAVSIVRSLEWLLILLAVFILVSMIAGISSWYDYRREETELLNKWVDPSFRKPPRLTNLWRWSETYLMLFTMAFVVVVSAYVETHIIPFMK